MNIQKNWFLKNSVKIVLLLITLVLISTNSVADSNKGGFIFKLFDTPLTIYSFPTQHGKANSNFNFNLTRYISVVKPEINYLVTNHFSHPLNDIELMDLPKGLTRIYKDWNSCSERFALDVDQSCVLHFSIDKNLYTYSEDKGPTLCVKGKSCSAPMPEQQFDQAIWHSSKATQVIVTPADQWGLHFDLATLSIIGKPTRPGVYNFNVSAFNDYGTAASVQLLIYVGIDDHDTPVFKKDFIIPGAMPNQDYHLSLIDLIEPTVGFMMTNQVVFSIDSMHAHPDWLSLDKENAMLQGHVPSYEAGKIKEVTIIATSNTGGDSAPLTIKIPVAFDPEKKPIIEEGIELTGVAGASFHNDFRSNIVDPTSDANLKLILDKVEPPAPWLLMSTWNPTELDGVVPIDAVGQIYQLTFYANTAVGGNSEPVTIPLRISIDKNLTPLFYADSPQFPLLYEGQPFLYDFVERNDIDPEYADIPYVVELAKGYNNPEWLRIVDNKLIADKVPYNINQTQQIFITIKNIPGGKSEILSLLLFIMN